MGNESIYRVVEDWHIILSHESHKNFLTMPVIFDFLDCFAPLVMRAKSKHIFGCHCEEAKGRRGNPAIMHVKRRA
jgi:hypothetical protein